MLKAYIDDSEMGQGPVYVLGGWVAQASVWAPFSDAWSAVLNMSPKIRYFKFAEAMNFTGEFAGISESLRDEKLRLLVREIADHPLLGISVSIPHRIFAPLFANHRTLSIRNPYVLAFFALVSRLVGYYGKQGVKDKIEFIFDHQPTFKSMELVQQGWADFLKTAPEEWRPLLTNHAPSFLDDKDSVGLQAADLHAGWVRAMNEAEELGLPQPRAIWGDTGHQIKRLYRHVTNEMAEQLFERIVGHRRVRFTYRFLDVRRVSLALSS